MSHEDDREREWIESHPGRATDRECLTGKEATLQEVGDFLGGIIEDLKQNPIPKYPQYQKLIVGWDETGVPAEVWSDVYGILVAFKVTNPATAHAIKKCLRAGTDHNETLTDLQEAKDALDRAMEIERGKA